MEKSAWITSRDGNLYRYPGSSTASRTLKYLLGFRLPYLLLSSNPNFPVASFGGFQIETLQKYTVILYIYTHTIFEYFLMITTLSVKKRFFDIMISFPLINSNENSNPGIGQGNRMRAARKSTDLFKRPGIPVKMRFLLLFFKLSNKHFTVARIIYLFCILVVNKFMCLGV